MKECVILDKVSDKNLFSLGSNVENNSENKSTGDLNVFGVKPSLSYLSFSSLLLNT